MNKKKLVKKYIQIIISRLCYDYGVSLEKSCKFVEELDLLNTYKDNYDYLLHEDVSTWVNLIVDKYKTQTNSNVTDSVKLNSIHPKHTNTPEDSERIVNLLLNGNKEENTTMTIDKLNEFMTTKLGLPKSFLEKSDKCCKTIERINNIMENYIVINGKKAELTKEQLEALGIEVENKRNNPFNNKINIYEDMPYYMIDHTDIESGVVTEYSDDSDFEKTAVIRANSFNNKVFANQVYLHELLNRKLLKYAWDNEAEDCEWDDDHNKHHYIYFDYQFNRLMVAPNAIYKQFCCVYFSKKEVAENAIKDVIEPFMKEHPEFVW